MVGVSCYVAQSIYNFPEVVLTSRLARLWLIFGIGAFAIIQLVYSASTLADSEKDEGAAAATAIAEQADGNVDSLYAHIQQEFAKLEPIWQKACNDCHTDRTDYPWYYKLPFVKGMIDKDIEEARAELDMSKGFPFVSHREPVDDLKKLAHEVEEGAMPPGKYTFMHWSASLSTEEKDSISNFVNSSLTMLASHGIVPKSRKARPEGQ